MGRGLETRASDTHGNVGIIRGILGTPEPPAPSPAGRAVAPRKEREIEKGPPLREGQNPCKRFSPPNDASSPLKSFIFRHRIFRGRGRRSSRISQHYNHATGGMETMNQL